MSVNHYSAAFTNLKIMRASYEGHKATMDRIDQVIQSVSAAQYDNKILREDNQILQGEIAILTTHLEDAVRKLEAAGRDLVDTAGILRDQAGFR